MQRLHQDTNFQHHLRDKGSLHWSLCLNSGDTYTGLPGARAAQANESNEPIPTKRKKKKKKLHISRVSLENNSIAKVNRFGKDRMKAKDGVGACSPLAELVFFMHQNGS